AAGAVRRRAAVGIDADAAFEQAADAGPLMAMQIGAAARRKRHAVATQEQPALRQCFELRAKFFARTGKRGCFALAGKLPSPQTRTAASGFECDRCLAAPCLIVAQF